MCAMSGSKVTTGIGLPKVQLPNEKALAEELFEAVRDEIVSGRLRAGTRLTDRDIATWAGVSRTPTAVKALALLQGSGLLRESPSGGLVINALSTDDLSNACVVRDELEALAARIAASTRTDLDIAMLRELTQRFEAAIGGPVADIVELNHAFHNAVWKASRNDHLQRTLRHTRYLIERLDSTTLSSEARQRQALQEHRAILDAITARDSDMAQHVTRDHFNKATAIRVLDQAHRDQRISERGTSIVRKEIS
jgi:DNA-binding GntR family transcriptional regulator